MICLRVAARRLMFLRLSTLNTWGFKGTLDDFENLAKYKNGHDLFQFPDEQTILSQCSHFVEPEAMAQFCDLISKLQNGPEAPQKAFKFAEHLVTTHDFFLPLRMEVTQQDASVPFGDGGFASDDLSPCSDELSSIASQFGGVHPSRNSRFQHLLARLRVLLDQSSPVSIDETHSLLHQISTDIGQSSQSELSEKLQLGACEYFMKELSKWRAPGCDFAIARKVLQIIFQILDTCPSQRHILMHMTQVERDTGQSLLEYLVKFVSIEDFSTAAGSDDADANVGMQTSALECIRKIVASSIPYHSLSDFPTVGCYGNPKMDSMLTPKVLQSILSALGFSGLEHRARFDLDIERKVLEAFFNDCEEATAFFDEKRQPFRAMIRQDQTAAAFAALELAPSPPHPLP